MSKDVPQVTAYHASDFREWLETHNDTERKVAVVVYKKHTGNPSPSHRELLDEALCFGWIDTTIKRLDEDRYIRHFARRTKNSNWSKNTLSYAERLYMQGRLSAYGKKMYELGKKKKTHDYGIPDNPSMPRQIREALSQNTKAKKAFASFPPSAKRMYYRWFLSAKQEKTRKRRIDTIIANALAGKKNLF